MSAHIHRFICQDQERIPVGERSKADRLLGLRVGIPPGA
jgi:hypothetical protein